eukprot:6184087-Pleurochrysis_carterae.AAC.2
MKGSKSSAQNAHHTTDYSIAFQCKIAVCSRVALHAVSDFTNRLTTTGAARMREAALAGECYLAVVVREMCERRPARPRTRRATVLLCSFARAESAKALAISMHDMSKCLVSLPYDLITLRIGRPTVVFGAAPKVPIIPRTIINFLFFSERATVDAVVEYCVVLSPQ